MLLDYVHAHLQNCSVVNIAEHISGSGNGLLPLGNKPLTELMLAHICIAIWGNMA